MDWWRWVRFDFGRHEGKPLDQVPLSYLAWVHENLLDLDPYVRRAVAAALKARGSYSPPPREQPAAGLSLTELAGRIDKVRRQLAGRLHPDRSGEPGIMVGVNLACDALRVELGLAGGVRC